MRQGILRRDDGGAHVSWKHEQKRRRARALAQAASRGGWQESHESQPVAPPQRPRSAKGLGAGRGREQRQTGRPHSAHPRSSARGERGASGASGAAVGEAKARLLREHREAERPPEAEFARWCGGFERDMEEFASVTLLCRLKLDQARLMCMGWKRPHRLKAAMACMCMEKICESLGSEQRAIVEEVFDELCSSIFCEPDARALVASDVLGDPRVRTFFEQCEELEGQRNALQRRLKALQSDQDELIAYLERTKHLSALRMLHQAKLEGKSLQAVLQQKSTAGTSGEQPGSPGKRAKGGSVGKGANTIAALENLDLARSITEGFKELGSAEQQQLLQSLPLHAHVPPGLEMALSVTNLLSESERRMFLKLTLPQLSDEELATCGLERSAA